MLLLQTTPKASAVKREGLEALYRKYNHRAFVHPDPLEFLYLYKDLHDREIVALIASSLAYGRVSQILKSVSSVLRRMSPSPCSFLDKTAAPDIQCCFSDFRHRFATGEHLASLLIGIKGIRKRYGSLRRSFFAGFQDKHPTVLPALSAFADQLIAHANGPVGHLVALPHKGSACKRLNLFLRWMVRRDEVDPGGWEEVSPSKLIVPVDVHMHRLAIFLGLTGQRQARITTAMEITEGFRAIAPADPAKYDFSLTRFGIRGDVDLGCLNQ
jgi:uncharacterized protein (TIGR02757 family)